MKIVAISDTHCKMDKINLPDGDVLVHAGDHSFRGSIQEMSDSLKKLKEKGRNFKTIVAIDGNHDWLGQKDPILAAQLYRDNGIVYLKDSWKMIDGKIFYGSPYQPEFYGWAFNLPRGIVLERKWAEIPDKVDILITHGPPKGILDLCPNGDRVGCADLFNRIMVVKPELHIFGHIHHSYGTHLFNGTTFINASVCTEEYLPMNSPIVVEL